jgi:hypothetical protein
LTNESFCPLISNEAKYFGRKEGHSSLPTLHGKKMNKINRTAIICIFLISLSQPLRDAMMAYLGPTPFHPNDRMAKGIKYYVPGIQQFVKAIDNLHKYW